MIQLDSTFSSCQSLQKLFQPLSPDLVALQMSRGPLEGRLRVFQLGAIRINLLETNQSLFLSGTRRPKPCTMAIPLEEAQASSPYRAQGILVAWPALMGYNRHLTDFDLKVPAGARLATIVIGKEVLLEQLEHRGGSERTLDRWGSTNQLELLPELQQRLRDQLNQLMQGAAQRWNPEDPDRLIDSLIQCFEEPQARTKQIAKREARHEAAIDLLHWCDRNPMKTVTVEALSAEHPNLVRHCLKDLRSISDRRPWSYNALSAWTASDNCCWTQCVVPIRASPVLATPLHRWASPAAATSLGAIRSNTENTRRTHSPRALRTPLDPGAISEHKRLHKQQACQNRGRQGNASKLENQNSAKNTQNKDANGNRAQTGQNESENSMRCVWPRAESKQAKTGCGAKVRRIWART